MAQGLNNLPLRRLPFALGALILAGNAPSPPPGLPHHPPPGQPPALTHFPHTPSPRPGDPAAARANYRWAFALSERLTDRKGAFAGVVAAVLDIEYVDRLFSTLDLAGSGYVALIKRDGVLVTRVPKRDALVGKRLNPPR